MERGVKWNILSLLYLRINLIYNHEEINIHSSNRWQRMDYIPKSKQSLVNGGRHYAHTFIKINIMKFVPAERNIFSITQSTLIIWNFMKDHFRKPKIVDYINDLI